MYTKEDIDEAFEIGYTAGHNDASREAGEDMRRMVDRQFIEQSQEIADSQDRW